MNEYIVIAQVKSSERIAPRVSIVGMPRITDIWAVFRAHSDLQAFALAMDRMPPGYEVRVITRALVEENYVVC